MTLRTELGSEATYGASFELLQDVEFRKHMSTGGHPPEDLLLELFGVHLESVLDPAVLFSVDLRVGNHAEVLANLVLFEADFLGSAALVNRDYSGRER